MIWKTEYVSNFNKAEKCEQQFNEERISNFVVNLEKCFRTLFMERFAHTFYHHSIAFSIETDFGQIDGVKEARIYKNIRMN